MKTAQTALIIMIYLAFIPDNASQARTRSYGMYPISTETANIKTVKGKFYAYIVLLFNENPHFINLIQNDTIPPRLMASEGFHIRAYRNYTKSLQRKDIKSLALRLMKLYLEPETFTPKDLARLEKKLGRYNIILKFSKNKSSETNRITLDYCIYGKKIAVDIKHPLLSSREVIYNVQPFIYYDEFSTSNSTFYFNMIYINVDEVRNDAIIARRIIKGARPGTLFFVGSRVTEDIVYCLKKYFTSGKKNIYKEIWEMFAIHELTHKIINNTYNYFDQVNGEELSLMSTIYAKPFLGLSVMYSYMNYNSINPHRIAAQNFIRFAAKKTGDKKIKESPSRLKHLSEHAIKNLSKAYFFSILKSMR